jgi:hypothetical protein
MANGEIPAPELFGPPDSTGYNEETGEFTYSYDTPSEGFGGLLQTIGGLGR